MSCEVLNADFEEGCYFVTNRDSSDISSNTREGNVFTVLYEILYHVSLQDVICRVIITSSSLNNGEHRI